MCGNPQNRETLIETHGKKFVLLETHGENILFHEIRKPF